ncbi:MAG: c-type cytochrome [Acetobacteraceae bacterium]
MNVKKSLRPARFFGPAVLMLCAVMLGGTALPSSVRAAARGNHGETVAALSDLNSAIAEILNSNNSYVTDRNFYHRASQRAINALEGVSGPEYRAAAGTPGDQPGAIGHLDALLHQKGTPVWAATLDGAEANIRGAVAHLLDANKAHDMMKYAFATSRALAYLEVARGRPNEVGVFGGLDGVLANTVLGVPEGATTEDGCADPAHAPSYGVHGGYIAWVAVPASDGTYPLAESAGESSLKVVNGVVVLETPAAPLVAADCRKHADAAPTAAPIKTAVEAKPTKTATDGVPALYTKAQAAAGAAVFATNCVSCHGANLQGTAAPSVAGNDFLKAAKSDGWTMQALRALVFTNMPFNNPGSLSPNEYAEVLAFLLASNCYPAGTTPFPTQEDSTFAHINVGPVPGAHPGENSFGVCPVS